MRRIPSLTVAVAATACLVHAWPAARGWLLHERALAWAQPWRLLGGSLVHWNASHLAMDVVAFVAGAALVERRGHGRLARLCAVAAMLVGVSVQLLAPGLDRYAGLSGVAYAVLAAAALDLVDDGATRGIGLAALGALAIKLWLDAGSPAPLVVQAGDVVATPVAHVAGFAAAIVTWWLRPLAQPPRVTPSSPAAAAAPTRARHAPAARAR